LYPHWKKRPEAEPDWFEALAELARYLRSPDGCPWDRVQTSRQFAEYAREELGELLESLDSGDNKHAEEEFGDVFFVLLSSAAAAEAEGRFCLKDALIRIHEKMVRRHDHVFGDSKAETPEDAIRIWNEMKAKEKQAEQT